MQTAPRNECQTEKSVEREPLMLALCYQLAEPRVAFIGGADWLFVGLWKLLSRVKERGPRAELGKGTSRYLEILLYLAVSDRPSPSICKLTAPRNACISANAAGRTLGGAK